MWNAIKEWQQDTFESFKRTHSQLPQTPEYAQLREWLRTLQQAPKVATDKTLRHLQKMTEGLDSKQLDILTDKVFMDDFYEDVIDGKEIPFFESRETFMEAYKALNKTLEDPKHKEIVKRVRKRRYFVRQITKQMVKAGLIPEEALNRRNYITHQVLEYAQAEIAVAGDSALKKPKWAKRQGTKLAINWNLMEAEAHWMIRALRDIETERTIQKIANSEYNRRPQLKQAIREHNIRERDRLVAAEIKRWYGVTVTGLDGAHTWWKGLKKKERKEVMQKTHVFSTLQTYRQLIGRAFGEIEAILKDQSPDVPAEFYDAHLKLSGFIEEEYAGEIDVWKYLSWLADGNLAELGSEDPALDPTPWAATVFKLITDRRQWLKDATENWIQTPNMDTALKTLRRAGDDRFDDAQTWQPDKGNLMFTAQTLSEKVMNRAMQHVQALVSGVTDPDSNFRKLRERGIPQPAEASILDQSILAEVVQSLVPQTVVGGPKYQMIVTPELAKTLDGFRDEHMERLVNGYAEKAVRHWKIWTLVNPQRWFKYNLANISGDLDHVIAATGTDALKSKYLKEAGKELWEVMVKGGKPSDMYADAQRMGVLDSGWSLNEVLDQASEFEHAMTMRESGMKPLRKMWSALKTSTTMRENMLRYSTFKWIVDQILTHVDHPMEPASPKQVRAFFEKVGFGATDRENIVMLDDWMDIAAKYARETLGDYGAISVKGRWLRNKAYPFWAWKEVNAKFYYRFVSNAVYHARLGKKLTPTQAKGISKAAVKTGAVAAATMYMRMFALFTLLKMYNWIFWGDEEDELTETDQRRLHIILGKYKGEIIMLRAPGALSDLFQWAGYEDAMAALTHVARGRGSVADVLEAVASGFANTAVGGITPLVKLPAEWLTGRTFFPDPLNPRPIRDMSHHVQRSLSVDKFVDVAGALTNTGRPTQGAFHVMGTLAADVRHADYSAYSKIKTMGYQHLSHVGEEEYGGRMNERSQAYYYYRLALKFGDKAAVDRYRKRLRELEVTPRQRANMIKRARPLGMMTRKQAAEFRRTMNLEEKRLLARAERYWRTTYATGR